MRTQQRRQQGESGFTLIELMVAIALSMIITFCITFVSSQAQQAYESTTAKVEVYQKFRYALNDVRDNLANMVPTANLEFFVDQVSNEQEGYWEEGEEIKEPENLDGGMVGKYDEGAHVIERTYDLDYGGDYEIERRNNYSLYFKTVTEIGGVERVANVEYFLIDPQGDEPRTRVPSEVQTERTKFKGFAFVKVVRYIDIPDIYKPSEREVVEQVTELCQNVTDFKVEYFAQNLKTNEPGRFVTPRMEDDGGFKPDGEPELLSGRDGGGVKRQFIYGGFKPLKLQRGRAVKGQYDSERSVNVPLYFWMGGQTDGTAFSELHRGDTIFLWSESGSSDIRGEFTIKRNDNGKLYFEQEINSALWQSDQSQIRFRAGYVPSSFRITLRVLNDRGSEARLMTVTVSPFRKNH